MSSKRITFQIKGKAEDNGDVRFDVFVKQLEAVQKALEEVGHLVTQNNSSSVYYRIVDLHHSTTTIEFEAVDKDVTANNALLVIDTFYEALYQINEQGSAPPNFDSSTLRSLKAIVSVNGIEQRTFSYNEVFLTLSDAFADKIEVILGPDEFESGEVTGTLDQINVHNQKNAFYLYSTWRTGKIKCLFPDILLKDAVNALGSYVSVYGRLRYKQRDNYPYEVEVQEIEIYPTQEELPTLSSLRGIAPDITGKQSSEEFTREIRDEWN